MRSASIDVLMNRYIFGYAKKRRCAIAHRDGPESS